MKNEAAQNAANAAIFNHLATHHRAWIRKVAKMNRTTPEEIVGAFRDLATGRTTPLELPGTETAYYRNGMTVAHTMNRRQITAQALPVAVEAALAYLDTVDAINLAQEAETLTYTAADYIALAALVAAEERAA